MTSERLLHEGSQVQPPVMDAEDPIVHLWLLLKDVLVLGQPEPVPSSSFTILPDGLSHLDLPFEVHCSRHQLSW